MALLTLGVFQRLAVPAVASFARPPSGFFGPEALRFEEHRIHVLE